MPNRIGAYSITDNETGKVYIGSSNDISSRVSTHKDNLRKGKHHNKSLQELYNNSLNKDFDKIFEVNKLFTETREEAYKIEQKSIDRIKGSDILLNVALDVLSPGRGIPISEENKKRLIEINTGKHRDAETKLKIKNSLIGKKHSDETKDKISLANKDRLWSDEQKQNLSNVLKDIPKTKAHIDKVAKSHYKEVICNGIKYSSIREFAEKNSISQAAASRKAKLLRGNN